MKKIYTLVFGLFWIIALASCGGNTENSASSSASDSKSPAKETASADNSTASKPAATNRKGKLIYKQYCVICHGADGKLAVSDAKDLSVSTIDMEERINQITNGKGLMTPYKDILSEEQIKSVAEYLDELKQ